MSVVVDDVLTFDQSRKDDCYITFRYKIVFEHIIEYHVKEVGWKHLSIVERKRVPCIAYNGNAEIK